MAMPKVFTLPLGIEDDITEKMTEAIGKPVTIVGHLDVEAVGAYGFIVECEGLRSFIVASHREIGLQTWDNGVTDLFVAKAEQLAQGFAEHVAGEAKNGNA
jgi:hypothetical protein